ncbi:hypothetical protein H1C71_018516 [Ictidomys tridecemlineatus]|nr:hypothetical protein H1C71_018516 [Ictidomys tridecemlineatus]KAG3263476.1 hypothetical protein H1C71_018516 [Ictidomys tridecemlineatus]
MASWPKDMTGTRSLCPLFLSLTAGNPENSLPVLPQACPPDLVRGPLCALGLEGSPGLSQARSLQPGDRQGSRGRSRKYQRMDFFQTPPLRAAATGREDMCSALGGTSG